MSCYIASNNNRFYAAVEPAYGAVAAITAANRIPAVKLAIQQKTEMPERKDKTGSRTFPGSPANLRKTTKFKLRSYMTGWSNQTAEPCHGALIQAALGGAALVWPGALPLLAAAGLMATFTACSNYLLARLTGLTPSETK